MVAHCHGPDRAAGVGFLVLGFALRFRFSLLNFPCDAAKKMVVKADKKRICLSPQGEFMRFPL
jgi:hypothetical protein